MDVIATAPARRARPYLLAPVVVLAVFALLAGLAVYYAHVAPPVTPTAQPAMCPPSVAIAHNLDAAIVQVNTPGPDVVTVDFVAGRVAHTWHLTQQVPAKRDVALFSLMRVGPVSGILVSSNKLGMCSLLMPAR